MREQLIKRLHGVDKGRGWIQAYCPWHEMPDIENHTPSLIIKDDLSFFKCTTKGCASGDINKLLKFLDLPTNKIIYYDAVDRTKLYKWQLNMIDNTPDLSFLCWDINIVKYLGIGFDGKKFIIPIWKEGNIVQCWKYKPGAEQSKKYKGMVQDAPIALFPNIDVLKELEGQDLYLTEGYGDTIAALSKGEAAATGGGKPHWKEEHLEEIFTLKWRKVFVVTDNDDAGKFLGQTLCFWLRKNSIEFTWIMPPDRLNDVTDAFKKGYSFKDFPKRETKDTKEEENIEVVNISLSELHMSKSDVKTQIRVLVSGKYEAPYRVPQMFEVECEQSSEKLCPSCPYGKGTVIAIANRDVVSLIGVSKEKLETRLKKLMIDRPARCPGCRVVVLDEHIAYVEELRVKISHDALEVDESNCDRKCFYFLNDKKSGLLVNSLYDLQGFSSSHPETQEICFVADKATTVSTDLDNECKCPALPYNTIEDIVKDISYNVTNIYNRPAMHKIALITLFSPLFCMFNDVRTRCYMETLLLGDSETGKSWIIKGLFKFFGVGRIQDGKLASVAGLLGGINENDRGRRFITPGILAEQDRRVLGIEELGNTHMDIIHAMREQRTSGVAAIGKIEKASYSARTRLLVTANPKSGRRTIDSYQYGIEALYSFMPDPADQRRFDFIHVVADDLEDWERYKSYQKVVEVQYTEKIARAHLSWAWSLKPEDIVITKKINNELIEQARVIGAKGHVCLPIFTKTNSLTKLLRISVSIAVLLGRTEVTIADVKEAAQLCNDEYDNIPNGYFDFCEEKYNEDLIPFPLQVNKAFELAVNPKELATIFKNTTKFNSLMEIKSYVHMDMGDNKTRVNAFVHTLFRNNCIKKVGKEFYKSSAFVGWLKVNIPSLKNTPFGEVETLEEL